MGAHSPGEWELVAHQTVDGWGRPARTDETAIAEADCFSVVGGGDTARVFTLYDLDEGDFTRVSVVGGAYLRALTGEPLVGVGTLEYDGWGPPSVRWEPVVRRGRPRSPRNRRVFVLCDAIDLRDAVDLRGVDDGDVARFDPALLLGLHPALRDDRHSRHVLVQREGEPYGPDERGFREGRSVERDRGGHTRPVTPPNVTSWVACDAATLLAPPAAR